MAETFSIDVLKPDDLLQMVGQNSAIFPHLVDHIIEEFAFPEPGTTYWVLRNEEGKPVGNIGLGRFGEAYERFGLDPEAWCLGYFQVQPAAREKGQGRRLMEHAMAEAKSRGIKRLWIDTTDREDQKVAYSLYTRGFGFELQSTHPLPEFDCMLHVLAKEIV